MIEHQQTQFEREPGLILLTGATGYVGGRLLRELERRQLRVRCLARSPEFLKPKAGAKTESVRGDAGSDQPPQQNQRQSHLPGPLRSSRWLSLSLFLVRSLRPPFRQQSYRRLAVGPNGP